MKRRIILLLCLTAGVLLFDRCKKDHSKSNADGPPSLSGSWELRQAQTRNIPVINYPSGNGNMLKFTTDSFSVYTNGTFVKSGHYTITADATAGTNTCLVLPANEYKNRIIFDADNTSPKIFLQLTKDSASFISGCFAVDSGYYYVYIRQ